MTLWGFASVSVFGGVTCRNPTLWSGVCSLEARGFQVCRQRYLRANRVRTNNAKSQTGKAQFPAHAALLRACLPACLLAWLVASTIDLVMPTAKVGSDLTWLKAMSGCLKWVSEDTSQMHPAAENRPLIRKAE
jgi:hypothetical protein